MYPIEINDDDDDDNDDDDDDDDDDNDNEITYHTHICNNRNSCISYACIIKLHDGSRSLRVCKIMIFFIKI